MSGEPITIYVALLNEGIDVWRPVQATVRSDIYTIISKNASPDIEYWQFAEGNTVHCKFHTFADGNQNLIAYANAEAPVP